MDWIIPPAIGEKEFPVERAAGNRNKRKKPGHLLTGWRVTIIRRMIWLNILWVALRKFGNPFIAFQRIGKLKLLLSRYRGQRPLRKYTRSRNRIFINYNTPGWPSAAFNRYAAHQLGRFSENESPTIHTLVFAITKKCGFRCEHCCEWDNLNKPDILTREDLLAIIHRFKKMGVAQVQLSGGEPLNRFDDITWLLENRPSGIDFWLYTTGYNLTLAKAVKLRKLGLTGITISLDHSEARQHNIFRGVADAYRRALNATAFARNAGLPVCYSLCATRDFISQENLMDYARLARENGVSFIQVLEPKAVGHYAGLDVALHEEHRELLERFYETLNYDPLFADYPSIVYHDYNKRRFGCSGSAVDYVYADTDGDIHNCPFCQRKLFSAFADDLPDRIKEMKSTGCSVFNFCTTKQLL